MTERDSDTTPESGPWAEVASVEREIRFVAYTSAGDPKLMDGSKMCAIWAGRLQKAINDAR